MGRRGHGGADAEGGLDNNTENFEGPIHLEKDAAGDDVEVAGIENVFDQDGELAAFEAGSRVLESEHHAQAFGNGNEQGVGWGRVVGIGLGIVDLAGLAEVEVEQEHAAGLVTAARPAA